MISDTAPFSYAKAAMSPQRAQVMGTLLAFPIALVTLLLHGLLWGFPQLLEPLVLFVGALVFLLVQLLSIVVHELLHAVGFAAGGASRQDIEFGVHWKALVPYAHCKAAMRIRSYRVAVVLPALVLGIPATAFGLAAGTWLATLYGFTMLAAAGGDFTVLWAVRHIPKGAWVQDHPREVGCLVLEQPNDEASADEAPADALSYAGEEPGSEDERPAVKLIFVFVVVFILSMMAGVVLGMLGLY